eukprot:c4095_g1_i2 orf=615-3179(+)
MEGSREGSHGLRTSEEFQDESGLELSLGLGLSSADSRQKWKSTDGPATRSPPSVDLTGEPSAGGTHNGVHPLGKPKPSNKASGLDAALKKFLEGRLDEQDESGKLLDGSNSFNLQKEKEKATPVGSHEKPGQQLDLSSDVDNKGNPFLFKELQVSTGLATARGQSPGHTMPLQLVDAFKVTPFGSNSGSPLSGEGLGLIDGDDAGQESSEQHKKFQEARKKRKHLIEEQKHQKKGKKEDKSGTHGFRRPGSNTWVNASALDMDKALLGLRGDDASEQLQQETSQDKPESGDAEKGYETDGNDSTGFDKNGSTDMGQNDSKGTVDDSKGVEVNFMPQFQASDMGKKVLNRADDDSWHLTKMISHATTTNMLAQGRDKPVKGVSMSSPNNQKDVQVSGLAIGRDGDKAGSPTQRQREKVPSETSSASTDGTEKMEEKSRGGGEASSSVPETMGNDKVPLMSAATPFFPPAATTGSAALPYPLSPYQMPYSLPVSVSHAPGMPFPYLMQYLPSGSEGAEQNSMRPVGSGAFQAPAGVEYTPPQFSSLEGASWMQQALRPPVVSSFTNASNGALYSRNAMGVAEDVNNRLQATRVHDNGAGNASLAAEASPLQNHPLFRAVVHSGTQDSAVGMPQLHQAADGPLPSSLQIPAVPHFSSQLGLSDHGELRSFKEQGGMNAFPGFAASVQGAQGPARPPSSSGVKEEGGQEQPKFGGKVDASTMQQAHHRNIVEPSNLAQEEFRRAIAGHFHQGSTENLSVLDGLGEELAYLHPGIAPGLKFGGTGTPPDLPWVYTTGSTGRTVSGVLYRLSRTQLRVVCACHGKHMSPVEFAQHASGVDVVNAEKNMVGNSSPLTSQAT